MSDEMIIRHCSPTLAGLKTGNLFSCPYEDKKTMLDAVRRLNRRLASRGVRMIPLRIYEDRVLLYLFRPNRLKADLSAKEAAEILQRHGYSQENPAQCLGQLCRRFATSEEFPHEIGLFLGYPPEDVQGFIDNRAKGYKCVGCWKVYGDEQKAKLKFAQYSKCTRVYSSQWAKGKSIERLTVAV